MINMCIDHCSTDQKSA